MEEGGRGDCLPPGKVRRLFILELTGSLLSTNLFTTRHEPYKLQPNVIAIPIGLAMQYYQVSGLTAITT